MAQSKYLKQNGEVIYPYTTTHEVLNSAGLGCFDWCNGIIWCYASRSSSTASWTINRTGGSNGITIASIAPRSDNTNHWKITFSSALPHSEYGGWVSSESSGYAQEIMGVFGRTTTYFYTDCYNFEGAKSDPVQMSILIIY